MGPGWVGPGWVGPENVAYLVSLIGSETRVEYKIGQGLGGYKIGQGLF